MKLNLKMTFAILTAFVLMTAGFLPGGAASAASVFYSADSLFSSRDLAQEADLSKAVSYTLSDNQDIHITAEGIYVLTGSASNATVWVEAGKEDKVQLVLSGVTVTNTNFPVIYVKSADKVFVTTGADSSLSVTGAFVQDGSTKTDGVIFSRSDLVLNGTATLTVTFFLSSPSPRVIFPVSWVSPSQYVTL